MIMINIPSKQITHFSLSYSFDNIIDNTTYKNEILAHKNT
ncbi:hypothetical protein GGR09_000846 [Bartonella heixiaziensis]